MKTLSKCLLAIVMSAVRLSQTLGRLDALPQSSAVAHRMRWPTYHLCYKERAHLAMKNSQHFKLTIATAFALLSTSAFGGQQTGQVTQVTTRASDGLIYFDMSGSHGGRPACATYSYWMIKDENSAAGKRQLAVLLTARATGK